MATPALSIVARREPMSMYCGWNDTVRPGTWMVTLPRGLRPILAPLASPSRSSSATHSGGYQWACTSMTRTRGRCGASCAWASKAPLSAAAAVPRSNPRRVTIVVLPACSLARACAISSPRGLLHVGAAHRHPELAPADVGEHGHALPDRLVRGAGEAQPHAAPAVGAVGRPFRPRIDGDTSCQRRLRQPSDVHRVGELDPEEDAALGILELGRRPELLGERLHQRLDLGAQAAPQFRHVLGEMARAELAQYHLLQRARAGIGLERKDAAKNLPRRHDKADPQRRGDRLGE